MRKFGSTGLALVAITLLLVGTALGAVEGYEMLSSAVAGGGGASTGGGYAITGTIGQHDAGALNGGGYDLSGGFGHQVALAPTPGPSSHKTYFPLIRN
jgi:hypothetical protein